jgi:hypothetical protein
MRNVVLFVAAMVAAQFVPLESPTAGQDKPTAKSPAKSKAEPTVVAKPSLPKYFKSLGLSDKQKKEVLKVRITYAAELAKLKEAMDALRLKETEDTEAILTEAQRARLKELRSK